MGFDQAWEPAPGNGKGCSIWSLPVMAYVSYFLMNYGMWPLCKVTSLDLAHQALKGLEVRSWRLMKVSLFCNLRYSMTQALKG